jgi:hypothetical protein
MITINILSLCFWGVLAAYIIHIVIGSFYPSSGPLDELFRRIHHAANQQAQAGTHEPSLTGRQRRPPPPKP